METKKNEFLLTIAIPTYNRINDLRVLLNAIKDQLVECVEVLISDNASTDGTSSLISSQYPWVHYYCNEENIGADSNFLMCYKKALGKYVWLVGSDDIVASDSISRIVEFLCNNRELDLVYLNHSLFEYVGGKMNIVRTYLTESEDYVLSEKNDFMKLVKARITFMSCIIANKRKIDEVENPKKFLGTSFIHTCLFLESTKEDYNYFGVISKPCVMANVTRGSAGLDYNIERGLDVFSKKIKYVLCDLAVQNNYSKKLMNHIYIHEIYNYITGTILRSKLNKNIEIKKVFWNSVYPSVKNYPLSWVTIIPAYFMPAFVAKFYYKVISKNHTHYSADRKSDMKDVTTNQ